MPTKQKNLLGRGARGGGRGRGGEPQGEGTQEKWLEVSGFMRVGLVSGLSLAHHPAWPMLDLTQVLSMSRGALSQD